MASVITHCFIHKQEHVINDRRISLIYCRQSRQHQFSATNVYRMLFTRIISQSNPTLNNQLHSQENPHNSNANRSDFVHGTGYEFIKYINVFINETRKTNSARYYELMNVNLSVC